jgi:hypothetical protein
VAIYVSMHYPILPFSIISFGTFYPTSYVTYLWALQSTSPRLGLGPLLIWLGSGANGVYSFSTIRLLFISRRSSRLPSTRLSHSTLPSRRPSRFCPMGYNNHPVGSNSRSGPRSRLLKQSNFNRFNAPLALNHMLRGKGLHIRATFASTGRVRHSSSATAFFLQQSQLRTAEDFKMRSRLSLPFRETQPYPPDTVRIRIPVSETTTQYGVALSSQVMYVNVYVECRTYSLHRQ